MREIQALSWEQRKDTLKKFAGLSLPIILTRSVSAASELTMAIMLAKVDTDHLAASGLINALQSLILRTGMNVIYPTGLIVSREKGAAPEKIGVILNAGYVNAVVLSVPFMVSLAFSGNILRGIGQPTVASDLTETYFRHYLFGISSTLLTIASQQASYKVDGEWVAFLISLIRRALFLFLGYGMLQGEYRMPKMGIAGFGLANGISVCLDQLLFILYFKLNPSFEKYYFFTKESFTFELLKKYTAEIFKSGIVMGGDAVIDFIVNFTSVILVGLKGSSPLSAAEVAMQFKNFFSIPISGMVQASSIIARAEKDIKKRKAMTNINTLGSLAFPVVFCLACFATSNSLVTLLIDKSDEKTYQLAKNLLWIVLLTMIPLDIQKMIGSGYRTVENYFISFAVNLVSTAFFGLGLGCLLNFETSLSSEGMYAGVGFGTAVGAFLMGYFWIRNQYFEKNEAIASTVLQVTIFDERLSLTSAQPDMISGSYRSLQ